EPADAPRHANAADPVDPRVGIGRIPGVELVAGSDKLDSRCDEPVHERQDVVAGYAERVPEAGLLQPFGQVRGDGRLRHPGRMDVKADGVKSEELKSL